MKKFIALIFALGVCSCLLAGCGEDSTSMAETSSTEMSVSLVASTQNSEETTMLDYDNGVVTDFDGIIGNEGEETTASY